MRHMIFLTLLLGWLAYLGAGSAFAQTPGQIPEVGSSLPSADEVNGVAKKLYCPVCPNTPLDVCETRACADWRAQIQEQLAAGWSQEEIMDYFVLQYGERVLAEPQRKGFTAFVWFLPLTTVVLGLLLVWMLLRNWRLRQAGLPAAEAAAPSLPPEVLARLEREIQEID
jgi:cytochrome c-type biogenesis protein CcmH